MHSAARPFPCPPSPRRELHGPGGLPDAGSPLWLASAARRWHTEPDEHAVARSVTRSVAALLPAGAEASITLLGPDRRPLPAADPAAPLAWLDEFQLRAGEGIVRTEILASSDRTAYAAYARGKRARDDVHAVGYGASKQEAERSVFDELSRRGGTRGQKVIYSYFSHGADSPAQAR